MRQASPARSFTATVAIAINVRWTGRRVFGRANLVKKNEFKARISLGRVRSRSSREVHDRSAKIRLPRFPELFDGSAVYEQSQADGDELFQELTRPSAFIFSLLERRQLQGCADLLGVEGVGTDQSSLTGRVCQISCAYCAIVRSDEKPPMPATFRIAMRAHASGWRYSASTLSCVLT